MTMSQQDKERLLRALQDDPVFLTQVRSLILTAELVELPERFAQFATNVTGFIERQEEFNARQQEFNARTDASIARLEKSVARLEEFAVRQEEFNARQEEFNARQEEFNARQEETNAVVERRLQRITDDLGDLKDTWPAVSLARCPTTLLSNWATKSHISSAATTCEPCCAAPRPMTFRQASGAAST